MFGGKATQTGPWPQDDLHFHDKVWLVEGAKPSFHQPKPIYESEILLFGWEGSFASPTNNDFTFHDTGWWKLRFPPPTSNMKVEIVFVRLGERSSHPNREQTLFLVFHVKEVGVVRARELPTFRPRCFFGSEGSSSYHYLLIHENHS